MCLSWNDSRYRIVRCRAYLVSQCCHRMSAGTPSTTSRRRLINDRAIAKSAGRPECTTDDDIPALLDSKCTRHGKSQRFGRLTETFDHETGFDAHIRPPKNAVRDTPPRRRAATKACAIAPIAPPGRLPIATHQCLVQSFDMRAPAQPIQRPTRSSAFSTNSARPNRTATNSAASSIEATSRAPLTAAAMLAVAHAHQQSTTPSRVNSA
jgi:hypothetical protein